MEFLVLPDSDQAMSADSLSGWQPSQVVKHPSGRIWIAGNWEPGEFAMQQVNGERVALLGTFSGSRTTDSQLREAISCRSVDRIHQYVPGSFFTILANADRVEVFGTLSGFRRVTHSARSGAEVASNSAALLLSLIPSSLRASIVPLALLTPRPPWPLSEPNYWHGQANLLSTHKLIMGERGGIRVQPRWAFPKGRASLTDMAPRISKAIDDAVRVRAESAQGRLSSDLSGGMDSTVLSFYASQHVASLTTAHIAVDDKMNDDLKWANRANVALGGEMLLFRQSDVPAWFDGWADTDIELAAEPEHSVRTEAMHDHIARRLADMGARIHIAGSGGDELFYPDQSILQGLRRESPRSLVRAVPSMASVHRWSRRRTATLALSRSGPAQWLASASDRIETVDFDKPDVNWDFPFYALPWSTPWARERIRALLSQIEEDELLEAPAATDAMTFAMIHRNGQIHRRLDSVFRRHGVRYEAPFLDDSLLELALQVQLSDRLNLDSYKPGLAAASKGVVPAEFLGRHSKGDYISLIYRGFNAMKADLAATAVDSRLSRAGYVDGQRVATFASSMQPHSNSFYPLEFYLAAERWIRSADFFYDTSNLEDLTNAL
jgi:asparagine synthase (glutamine-hydrolysing)